MKTNGNKIIIKYAQLTKIFHNDSENKCAHKEQPYRPIKGEYEDVALE